MKVLSSYKMRKNSKQQIVNSQRQLITSMKSALMTLLFWLVLTPAFAQVVDDFADGDFTNTPVWIGITSDFIVDNEVLRLNAPAVSGESYLTTNNSLATSTIWEFSVRMEFNPSSTSQVFAYLISDQADLQGSLNGYFVQIGNSADEISLYRQDGNTTTIIIDGADDAIDASQVDVNIRITRDHLGNWSLFRDINDGNGEVLEGTALDNTYTSSSHFGFLADYIASRSTLFFFDNVVISPPVPLDIDTVIVNNERELLLVFNRSVEETSAELATNYSINNGITIDNVTLDALNSSQVIITTNQDLIESDYIVTTNNVVDEFSNTISATLTADFDYLPLLVESVTTLSDSEIEVTFNQPVEEISAETNSNYLIDNGIDQPSAVQRNPTNFDRVTISPATPLLPGIDYTVAINNVLNQLNNSTFSGTSPLFQFVIPFLVDSAFATSENTISVVFNAPFDETSALIAGNYSLDLPGGGALVPTSVVTVNDSTSALSFGQNFVDGAFSINVNGVSNLDNSQVINNGTSSFNYLNLVLSQVNTISSTQIEVIFNQAIDSISARVATNYEVNFGIGNPTTAFYTRLSPDRVLLTFENLVNNQYQLSIGNLSNQLLNSQVDGITGDFQVITATAPRDIVINEIFADPNPSVGLPGSEFLELLNLTDDHINLNDFQISGGTLPDFTIAPGALVILTSTGNADDYTAFGDVLGVTSFPSLTNAGRSLVLQDNLGNQVDSLAYDLEWYDDPERSDGGYSLELINPQIPCNGDFNWTASDDTNGGTPGTENSVFDETPDTTPPFITGVTVIQPDSLVLLFSEPIDPDNDPIGTFSIVGNSTAASGSVNEGFGGIALRLTNELVSENFITITSEGVRDCSGNSSPSADFTFFYDVSPPRPLSIVVNSFDQITVFFNEPLIESVAEVESNYLADNGLGEPNSSQLDEETPEQVQLSFSEDFDPDLSYQLSITNLVDTLNNAISTETISFQFIQSIDSVAVIAPNLLDIYFNTALDQPSATNIDNYQLEEIGSPTQAFIDQEMGNLVHLIFSENIRENSERSLFISNVLDDGGNLLSTPEFLFTFDTRAAVPTGVTAIAADRLQVNFDEPVLQASAELVNNYELEANVSFPDSARLQPGGEEVVLFFRNPFEQELEQSIFISEVADVFGNATTTRRRFDFTFDTLPPRLDSLIQLSPDTVLLQFSEVLESSSSLALSNFSLSNGTNPQNVSFTVGSETAAILAFADDLPESEELLLTINGITDQQGNTIAGPIIVDFNTLNPRVSEVAFLDAQNIDIRFSKAMDNSTVSNLNNYSLSSSAVLNSVTAIDDQQVRLNLSEPLADATPLSISFGSALTDLNGNALEPTTVMVQFLDQFESAEVINSNTITLAFEVSLDEPALGNFSLSSNMSSPTAVSLDPDDNNIVRLFFIAPIPENESISVSWQGLTDEFGNRIPNGQTSFIIDTQSPEVINVTHGLFNDLTVTFSEAVDEETSLAFNHYLLEGPVPNVIVNIESVDEVSVNITFQDNFIDNEPYTLEVTRVTDLTGNIVEDTEVNFTYVAPNMPQSGDIILTEIFADPNPVVGLPEVEFVEIFNNSDLSFNLSLVSIADPSGVATLPNILLEPAQYAILTDPGDTEEFEGNVIAVAGIPSLGNSGDTLSLISFQGDTLDLIGYSLASYNDPERQSGGYSLERISLLEVCNTAANWTASDDPLGGTPGAENSVLDNSPDTEAPEIVDFRFTGDSLVLTFNEPMDTLSFQSGQYQLNPAVTFNAITASTDRLNLFITAAFDSEVFYNLSVSNITDCSGNEIAANELTFGVGPTPVEGEIIITEIMADPTPVVGLPDAEYVEIYNASASPFDLSQISFADPTTTAQLPSFILAPQSYVLLTSNSNVDLFGSNTLGVTGFPSLGNSVDSLFLINSEGTTIDFITYTTASYNDEERDGGGYSLERISLLPVCNVAANWTASDDPLGGTPGTENSVLDNSPDTQSPEIVDFRFTGDSLVLTFNEPMDTLSFQSGQYQLDPTVTFNTITASTDRLNLAITAAFDSEVFYNLSVSNITDCTGNEIAANELTFGVGPTPAEGEIIITEIMADPTPVVGLPDAEYVEIYNASDSPFDLSQISIADPTATAQLPSFVLEPQSYVLLTSNSNVDLFGSNTLGVTGFPSLGNSVDSLFLINSEGTTIDFITYTTASYNDEERDGGGYSLERISLLPVCNVAANWTASDDPLGGTPGTENSVLDNSPDTQSPEIVGFRFTGDSLVLTFNEPMDTLSFQSGQYQLDPAVTFNAITASTDRLNLFITAAFDSEVFYTLSVTNITDCTGNEIAANELTFGVGPTPVEGEIIITEIMADPTPVVGLPDAEYVEIYNASTSPFDLSQISFADPTATAQLPSFILAPQSYALLTSNSNVDLFGDNTLGVTGFPSLGNSVDSLFLINSEGTTIDFITYTTASYNDEERDGGGYSLERISLLPVCNVAANWTASDDPLGGTPGIENSVLDNSPDTQSPEIVDFRFTGDSLVLTFNEPMDTLSFQTGQYELDPTITFNTITASTDRLNLFITAAFDSEVFYTLSISNITDCSGNEIAANELTFGVGPTPAQEEIIITEIMADPTPVVGLPDAEYVEIYNASASPFDLSQISFADPTATAQLPSFILAPQEYVLLTSNSNVDLFGSNTLGVTGFPSLGNSVDSLFLINSEGTTVDFITYTTASYNDEERDGGGYSLERISLLPVCNVATNWTASDDPLGGTPGTENSVLDNSPDTQSPEIVDFRFTGDSLVLTFNEPMDTLSFQSGQYQLDPAITFNSITASTDRLNLFITAAFDSEVFYTLSVSNITDCTGNEIAANELTFGVGPTPAEGEIIITEIMADPTPVVGLPDAEYVEIYNASASPFDLSQISFADPSTVRQLPNFILAPEAYVVLTSNSNVDLFGDNTLGVTGFPSLGNSVDSLFLINSEGATIDFITYTTASYNDEERDGGGYSLERISLLPVCNVAANWTASDDPLGGTPGVENSVLDNSPDVTSPEILSFQLNEGVLTINFSEPMDTLSFSNGSLTFTPALNVNSVSPSADRLSLQVAAGFEQGILYQLLLEGITDCSGNLLLQNSISLGIGGTPGFGDLIITEIMADPEPTQGLPITEYLEVLNTTEEILTLNGITLTDATGATPLPSGIILPGQYLVLTPSNSVSLFADDIAILGVSNWLSLNNGGERLTLLHDETEIFTVNYQEEWYDDPLFDGGRSLEMIDVTNFCGEDNNWTVADEAVSGTPGTLNSVTTSNPDLTGPALVSAFAIDENTIELTFNERILLNIDNSGFLTEPGLSFGEIGLVDDDQRVIQLATNEVIPIQTTYTISASGLTDCVGNANSQNELEFVLAEAGEAGDLVLNEVLFNPRTNGRDFVELFNRSERFINLRGWAFANESFFDTGDRRIITDQNIIIAPGQHLAFTDDRPVVLAEYPSQNGENVIEVNSLPTLPNDAGTIMLLNPVDEIMDQFDYEDDFHFDLLESVDGVSLERINTEATTNDPNNWRSAASTVGFATPGEQNSQSQLNGSPEATIAISPKVFVPGVSGSPGTPSFTTINYRLDNGGSFANVNIYDSNGQFVANIANGELLSTEGFFRWDGQRENGEIGKVGYYIVVFELFDNSGNTEVIKETVVIGTQF